MSAPTRKCTGRLVDGSIERCDERATLVCTAPDRLQWFACDLPEHSAGTTTEPIDQWFARILADHDAPTMAPPATLDARELDAVVGDAINLARLTARYREGARVRACLDLVYVSEPGAPAISEGCIGTVAQQRVDGVVLVQWAGAPRAFATSPENLEPAPDEGEPMPNPAIGARTAAALLAYMRGQPRRRVAFVCTVGDGEGPWRVDVDGHPVIDELRSEYLDVSDRHLEPLWAALGLDVVFTVGGRS